MTFRVVRCSGEWLVITHHALPERHPPLCRLRSGPAETQGADNADPLHTRTGQLRTYTQTAIYGLLLVTGRTNTA